MKLSGTYDFDAPREKVYAALQDPDVLRNVIEGCEELVRSAEDVFEAKLRIGIAAIRGAYKGRVQFKDRRPPESFTLVVEGKGTGGFVRSTAQVRLSEVDGRTRLEADAEATVGGLIAAVGSRLIEGVAKKMMADFFQRLAGQF